MCGIAGFVGAPNPGLLKAMQDGIRHRGPDQDGLFESVGASLAHIRLSIIDLSEAGRQPMSTADGRFTIVYNGEIYNYLELRESYEREGYVFRTRTDTECFLASVTLHGLEDLHRFHGIFAFAIWDAKERVCFIARDRMGIKPLYTAAHDGRVAFASEIKPLLALKRGWKIDATARAMYLAVGYVSGLRTMFKGVLSIAPGVLWRLQDGKFHELLSFTQTEHQKFSGPYGEGVKALPSVIDSAVQRQLVSDRPVGIFLSGGLDSSVVLSSMRRANLKGEIKSFTTRFRHHVSDPKFNIDADLAVRTAKRYGCEHFEIEVGADNVIAEAQNMARYLGQPHNNSSTIALDAAAQLASSHVPVVLSGDGGDELFGGYERYRLYGRYASALRSPAARQVLWNVVKHTKRGRAWHDILHGNDEASRLLTFHALPAETRQACFSSAFDDAAILDLWSSILSECGFDDPVSRFMAVDRKTWLEDDAFVRSDRLTMRHGVELRVPLLDDAVVSFATSLPRSWLVTPFQTKRIWRDAFSDRCLPEVISGKKRGWITPAAKWLRVGLTDWARDLLEEAINDHAWLNGPVIRKTFEDHLASRAYGLYEVWTVIAYQLWWREYKAFIEPENV